MRRAGIGCIMLKGAALRSLGLYRAGERPMGDVDLLARAADFEALASVLLSLGYTQAFATRRETVFEPHGKPIPHVAGEHVDNPLKFEIHTAIAEPLPVRQVDITTCLNLADARPGLNGYPDLGALMTHLLLHAAGNMRAHALRQIQLHDIAALASRLGDHEWQALLTGPRGAESPWWAFPPIALTARYYPGSIPTEVVNKLRALCPPVLRFATDRKMLTDVSWSNLRIHAFPGIAWSRTPLDALRFIASRVLPDHTALAELEVGLKAQPQLSRVPWYGLSHGRRIVRWLFSYPPRVQTLMSVAADLESAKTAASYPSPPPSQ
jgi:hypothetical protein